MSGKSPAKKLKGQLNDLEDHIDASYDRILSFYFDSVDPPDDYPPLDKPPHNKMLERSGMLVYFAAADISGRPQSIDGPIPEVEYLLYGPYLAPL